MENDPDAALVDSFFLPGGILDPESYEQDEKLAREGKSTNLERKQTPSSLTTFKGFSPANIDPNNPWATVPATTTLPPPSPPPISRPPAMTYPQRESSLFPTSRSSPLFAPKRFSDVTNTNSMIPHYEGNAALSETLIQNRIATMAPPPGFESSIPHPERTQSTFPAIRIVGTFEEEDSIAYSVPRELIPAHQDKDSVYGDGSSTSSLSHSTCGGHGRSLQEEDILLETDDEQQVLGPVHPTVDQEEQRSQQNGAHKIEQNDNEIKQAETFQLMSDTNLADITIKKEDIGSKRKGKAASGSCNSDSLAGEKLKTTEKIALSNVELAPSIKNKIEVQRELHHSPIMEVPSPPLSETKNFSAKSKKRRGQKRASSSSRGQKDQHHQLCQPSLDQKHIEIGPRKSNHSKVFGNSRSKNQQKLSKGKLYEDIPMGKLRQMSSWSQNNKTQRTHHRKRSWTRWIQFFFVNQQQQKIIHLILLLISVSFVIIRAALNEIWRNISSLFIYLFFWVFPYISKNLLVQMFCLPHWISQVTTLIVIWELCTPTTSPWINQCLWYLFCGRRFSKNKMENISFRKIDLRCTQEHRLVLILYAFRIALIGMFIYDGFSQPQSSILLFLGPSSRTLVAYILLVIKRGWYHSPLLLLWSPLMQILIKFIFFSSKAAVIFNVIIGLASLRYKEYQLEAMTDCKTG